MITIAQVKQWFIQNGIGHIVTSTNGGWTSTACGDLNFGGGTCTDILPKKICKSCRASMDKLTPHVEA
jgi:hypothetical protein